MRKEVIYAIVAGGVFGLIIAFGVFRANQALQSKSGDLAVEITGNPDPDTDKLAIAIASPENKEVFTSSTTKITGITQANIWVVVSVNEDDQLVLSDSSGSFNADIKLDGGLNNIVITSIKESGENVQNILSLVFSTEFEGRLQDDGENTKEASDESGVVREKVAEKILEAKDRPIAYLGTITDILAESIQTKSDEDQIQQVATNESTTYADITGATETIKFEDLAIGDFVMSLGYKNGNEVLSAKRILVANPPEETKTTVLAGKFSFDEDGNEMITRPSDGKTFILDFSEDLAVIDQGGDSIRLRQVDDEATVIIVGKETKGGFEARTLFVVIAQDN